MAEEDRGEKSEAASPRKREEARRKGMIAQSQDLSQALVLAASLAALTVFAPRLATALQAFMHGWLMELHSKKDIVSILLEHGPALLFPVGLAAVFIIGAVALAGIAVGMLQAGLQFNFELLEPKWERIDPMAGFERIFSLTSLVSTLFGVLKLAVVGWGAYGAMMEILKVSTVWWQVSASGLLPLTIHLLLNLGWSVAVPMLLLAGADYGYKRWKYERELMMTKEEVREENKQQEGDPQIKQRIRQIQRARAMRRMMQDVPKATVIITNPTHVAVALRYEPGTSLAPMVVAKGEHLTAQRIKQIAHEHGIPVIEEPPLARAMLRSVAVGQEISIEFYKAVAEILALLYKRTKAIQRTAGIRSERYA